MDRKNFFKNIAHAIGDNVANRVSKLHDIVEDEPELTIEQKDFLQVYTTHSYELGHSMLFCSDTCSCFLGQFENIKI